MTRSAPSDPPTAARPVVEPLAAQPPVFLRTAGWDDYALLDMGHARKLERYGERTIIRPEPQALGAPRLPEAAWLKADSVFTAGGEEDGAGRWRHSGPFADTWPLSYGRSRFLGRFTAIRHVGVFPEQAAHWEAMSREIRQAQRPLRILNLFGYTGVASLIAAEAGAEVTHVDASKKAIAWARENQALSRMDDLPIRWICDDARKFVEREARRNKSYDGILVDPPKFGRGPKGEVWNLFDDLPAMIDGCAAILTPRSRFMVLTTYAIRASFFALDELMRERLAHLGGGVQSGELLLTDQAGDRALSTSLFSRWTTDG